MRTGLFGVESLLDRVIADIFGVEVTLVNRRLERGTLSFVEHIGPVDAFAPGVLLNLNRLTFRDSLKLVFVK